MRRLAQISAIAVLLVACSGASKSTTTTTLAVPVTVSSGWITYTDETSGFALSYPGDWEAIAIDNVAIDDLFANFENAPDLDHIAIPLQAGLADPSGGFNPNVGVAIEPLPIDITTDDYAEASRRNFAAVFASYESTEQVKTVVAGREAVLIHGSYDLSEVDPNLAGRWWMIQLVAVDGRTGWTVSCGVLDASTTEPDLELCDAVVRTFELSSS